MPEPNTNTGLLDDVPMAESWPMEQLIDDVKATPTQAYEPTWKAPEMDVPEGGADPAVQEASAKVAMQAQARLRAAGFIMSCTDRLQAWVFTWFGAKGHQEDFEMAVAKVMKKDSDKNTYGKYNCYDYFLPLLYPSLIFFSLSLFLQISYVFLFC